jgi:hypothetical protein
MQNKPYYFKLIAHMPTSPNGLRVTGHEKMQNEPNLNKNSHNCLHNIDLQIYLHPALLVSANNQSSIINNQWKGEPNFKQQFIPEKHENVSISQSLSRTFAHFSLRIHQKTRTFTQKYPKNAHFSQTFMQNEANFKTSRIEHRKNAKQTQFLLASKRSADPPQADSSTHLPIHQKMQNEPNLTTNASSPTSPNGSRAEFTRRSCSGTDEWSLPAVWVAGINMQNKANYNTPNKLKGHQAMSDSINNHSSIINIEDPPMAESIEKPPG